MALCIVKECPNSPKKMWMLNSVSLHCFPRTVDEVRNWLTATRQYSDTLDEMVNRVLETNKSSRYRMTSENFYAQGLKMYRQRGSVPTIFGSQFARKIKCIEAESSLPSNSKAKQNIVVSLDNGQVVEHVIDSVVNTDEQHSISFSQPVKCHTCGHHFNKQFTDVVTATDYNRFEKETQFQRFYCTSSCRSQTDKMLCKTHNFTSTRDLCPPKDAYTWTMGNIQMSVDKSIQTDNVAFSGLLESTVLVQNTEENLSTVVDNMSPIYPSSPGEFDDIDNGMVESALSTSYLHNSILHDPNYTPENSMLTDEDFSFHYEPTLEELVKDQKYVVFETNIDYLLKFVPRSIPMCNAPVISKTKTTLGSILVGEGECLDGHNTVLWKSQPTIGKNPVGNLLFCASILFSGNHFEKIN
ncbi:uncharacterized protein LOC128659994 [Bombina bombina]|uniref:uncharacterized protein LOC128659994 n=1 Tax=Bombina bombina TaxID=8345 RepID=UPI00235B068A|nr:uncharacterized protein LOC128659994 [Bombina bombina]